MFHNGPLCLSNPNNHQVGSIFIPIFQKRKVRLSKIKQLTQCHPDRKYRVCVTPKSMLMGSLWCTIIPELSVLLLEYKGTKEFPVSQWYQFQVLHLSLPESLNERVVKEADSQSLVSISLCAGRSQWLTACPEQHWKDTYCKLTTQKSLNYLI